MMPGICDTLYFNFPFSACTVRADPGYDGRLLRLYNGGVVTWLQKRMYHLMAPAYHCLLTPPVLCWQVGGRVAGMLDIFGCAINYNRKK